MPVAPGPTLQTERLILRPPAAEDFEAWAAFAGDPEAARFIGGVQARPVAWRALRAMAGGWALDGFAMFSVLERSSGRWLGRIGPWSPDGWPGTEVGWGLAREAWGRGYAVEAAAATMDWVVDKLGWTDIIHTIDPANTASIAVAERLGSRRRGPVKLPAPYEGIIVDAWGQTREEWLTRRAG